MALLQASDHTFATVSTTRSEHSICLEEIDYDDDDDYDADEMESELPRKGATGDSSQRRNRCCVLGGVLGGGGDDDCSFSESTLHVFVDEWNDTALGGSSRFVKSLAKPPVAYQDGRSSQSKHNTTKQLNHASAASLNKSRRIASMLYQSISEMLHNSHRDMGALSLDSVAKNIDLSLLARGGSVEAQKEALADLLATGLRDLDELENRSAAAPVGGSCAGPLHQSKRAVFLKQKDQLVGLLSDVFSKIEELNAAEEEGGESRNDRPGAKASGASPPGRDSDSSSNTKSAPSGRPSKKRQSSFHSDVSSITSRTTASLHSEAKRTGGKGAGAMFNLPAALKAEPGRGGGGSGSGKPKPKPKGATSRPKSATAAAPTPSRSASPKGSPSTKPSAEGDLDITLQDSFSSFCAIDADDKTPKRPQRRGSFGGAKSGQAAEAQNDSASPAPATTSHVPRQPPSATRSLDDVVAGPRMAPRRPGGQRKSDVRVSLPQRQRSFDGER